MFIHHTQVNIVFYSQIRGVTISHWGLRSGNCVGQFLYWGIHWEGQCAHGLPDARQDHDEQVSITAWYSMHHYIMCLHRADYCKALHFDPCCLPARVNLAYTLQVSFIDFSLNHWCCNNLFTYIHTQMEEKYQRSWNHFTCALVIDPSKLQP